MKNIVLFLVIAGLAAGCAVGPLYGSYGDPYGNNTYQATSSNISIGWTGLVGKGIGSIGVSTSGYQATAPVYPMSYGHYSDDVPGCPPGVAPSFCRDVMRSRGFIY